MDLAPHENLVYFGDTARYPYGPKSPKDVLEYSREIARYLVSEHDVKLVVIACNTASAHALDVLSEELDIPVVGVLDAGVRAAITVSTKGNIGVMATVGTVASGAYQDRFRAATDDFEVTFQACPGLVEFVERCELYSDEVLVLLGALLEPLRRAQVDTVLLGCTHYPFLSRAISDVLHREVVLVSSAEETAFEVAAMLRREDIENDDPKNGVIEYVSTGDAAQFGEFGSSLMNSSIDDVLGVSVGYLITKYGGDRG